MDGPPCDCSATACSTGGVCESNSGSCCQQVDVSAVAEGTARGARPSSDSSYDDLDAALDATVLLEDEYTKRGRDFGWQEGERRGIAQGYEFGYDCSSPLGCLSRKSLSTPVPCFQGTRTFVTSCANLWFVQHQEGIPARARDRVLCWVCPRDAGTAAAPTVWATIVAHVLQMC